MSRILAVVASTFLIGSSLAAADSNNTGPKKLAFIVGVAEYQKDGLTNLNYADDDAEALQRALTNLGFEVDMLLRSDATGANIRSGFAKFLEKTSQLGKEDIVFVSLSGHGIQIDLDRDGALTTEAFYCPYDALKSNPATLVPINDFIRGLQDSSGSSQNLMVIDACRNDPTRGAKGLDGSTVRELPAKLSLWFGCSTGQQSFESEKVKHGILTHVLLEGLKGEAADRRGDITWLTLASYATSQVPVQARTLLENDEIVQRPNLVGNLTLVPVLTRVELPVVPPTNIPAPTATPAPQPAPAKLESKTNSVAMKLLLIPAGDFQMGSPVSDGSSLDNERPVHLVRNTKPFYLGQTEVTQAQWKAVMGTSPWSGMSDVIEGDRYPATYVNHDDAVRFCRKLSVIEGKTYRLPTEAEWEYACRAGTTTTFHFGDTDGRFHDFAWFENNTVNVNEKYAHHVGQKLPNPWGLHDMHGNVWEWCYDWFDAEFYARSPVDDPAGVVSGSFRVTRGGSWYDAPPDSRSGVRYWLAPGDRYGNLGFRVVLIP